MLIEDWLSINDWEFWQSTDNYELLMIVDRWSINNCEMTIENWGMTIDNCWSMICLVWVTIFESLYKLKAISIVSSFPHKVLKVQQEINLRKDVSTSIG